MFRWQENKQVASCWRASVRSISWWIPNERFILANFTSSRPNTWSFSILRTHSSPFAFWYASLQKCYSTVSKIPTSHEPFTIIRMTKPSVMRNVVIFTKCFCFKRTCTSRKYPFSCCRQREICRWKCFYNHTTHS